MNVDQLGTKNGITVQVHQVAEDLVSRGHNVDLVYRDDGELGEDYGRFCDSLVQVPGFDFHPGHLWRDLPPVLGSLWRARSIRSDLIYLNRTLPLTWAAAERAVNRVPVLCHVHGPAWTGSAVYNRVISRVAARYIAVSRYVADDLLRRGVPAEKVAVVHNGIEPDRYRAGGAPERTAARQLYGIEEEAFVAMFFGRITPGKGPEILARAVASAARLVPEMHLMMVGDPSAPGYVRALRIAAQPVKVTWLPNSVDVVTPLHAADVVVVPSLVEEPLGRTAIEALSTGRPVCASAIGGLPEVLSGDLCHLLFPPGDSKALARLLVNLRSWPAADPDLGRRCRQVVLDRFNFATMMDAIESEMTATAG